MEQQEKLHEKLTNVLHSAGDAFHDLANVIEEGFEKKHSLVCVRDGLLDYDLIKEDVKQIHHNLQTKGDRILGSHLILDDKHDLMEIRTYTEMRGKTFLSKISSEVKRITNIPEDVFDELKKNGRVELSLKL